LGGEEKDRATISADKGANDRLAGGMRRIRTGARVAPGPVL
jgi:hypothetical protein